MPVIMINSLELLDYQKKNIAKRVTEVLSRETNVPEEAVYVFFGGYPLNGISAGGVLNSNVPTDIMKMFITSDIEKIKQSEYLHFIKYIKSKYGQEKNAKKELIKLAHQARAAKGCIKFDIFESNIDIISGRLERSNFIIKEVWENTSLKKDFESNNDYKDLEKTKGLYFEDDLNSCRRISPFNGKLDEEYSDKVYVTLHLIAKDGFKEKVKDELLSLSDILKTRRGCMKCDIYQSMDIINTTNVFIIEQVWENSKLLYDFGNYKSENIISDNNVLAESIKMNIFDMVSTPLEHISVNGILGDAGLMAGLVKLNPDFGELCIDASAVPWGKPLIDQKTKVLIAIAIDIVEQITGKPFENHINIALKQGVTREELEELLLFMTIYAGFNKAGVFYKELDRILGQKN